MSERGMVERVARAICEAERMNPDDKLGGWIHWQEAARAAIAAMREPTPGMIAAALPMEGQHRDPAAERIAASACFILEGAATRRLSKQRRAEGHSAALDVIGDWRAMIDAALTEGEGR